MRKTLYIDQTGKLGGGELAILPWLCHCKENAHVVLLEDGPFRELLQENGVQVDILSLGAIGKVRRESGFLAVLSILPAFLNLRRRFIEIAFDFNVLYANSQKAFLLAALAKRSRQKLIWHLRDILTAEEFHPILRKVAIWASNRYAAVVLCNSQATAEAFVNLGGRRELVRVIYDGVGPAAFDSVSEETVRSLRLEIAPGQKYFVGSFSRLSPWKGQHVLLEAISSIPNIHVVLVGDALFGEDAYMAELHARAERPDLAGRVSFLGFRRDIPALMRSMDIVAHTSTSAEPFGLVIVEGMLAQRPVIATRAGGAAEIVEDGVSGLLVEPGSVTQLRNAILVLLNDPESRERLATAGRRRAEEDFSLHALFTGLQVVLDELTDQTQPVLLSRSEVSGPRPSALGTSPQLATEHIADGDVIDAIYGVCNEKSED